MTSNALVQVRATRKAQLIHKLGLREKALFDAELRLREARAHAQREQADVDALSDGPEHLLLSLTGQLDERMGRETDEAQAAAAVRQQCEDQRGRLAVEVSRIQAGIAALGSPEAALAPCSDPREAENSQALMRRMGALSQAYDAQDALHLLRRALDRAEAAAQHARDEAGVAHAHARALTVKAHERFSAFEDELEGLVRAVADLGPLAPIADLPQPGQLHAELITAWRKQASLQTLQPRWQHLERQIEALTQTLEHSLRAPPQATNPPQWHVGALFLKSQA